MFIRDVTVYAVPVAQSSSPAPLLPNHYANAVDWAPYGADVTFERYDDVSTTFRIWGADDNGNDAHEITAPGAGFEDHTPSWSPEADRIAYVRDEVAEIRIGRLWIIRSNGTLPEEIPDPLGYVSDPDWGFPDPLPGQ